MRRNNSKSSQGGAFKLFTRSFSSFFLGGERSDTQISQIPFFLVVVSAFIMITLAEKNTRRVRFEADERDALYQRKLDEMTTKFHTRCGVSDRQLQQMERERARLKGFEKDAERRKSQAAAFVETIQENEAKITSLEEALAKYEGEIKQLREEINTERANAKVKTVKDEDVHCKDVLGALALARKNVTEAEQRCQRRLNDCSVKTGKWKRKHASVMDKLALVSAKDAVAETRARVELFQQSIALTLVVYQSAPNSEWNVAQRLSKLKKLMDDDAKSNILASCHRPTDEDELSAKLDVLVKGLNAVRVEHEHAEENLASLLSEQKDGGDGSGEYVVGQERGTAAATVEVPVVGSRRGPGDVTTATGSTTGSTNGKLVAANGDGVPTTTTARTELASGDILKGGHRQTTKFMAKVPSSYVSPMLSSDTWANVPADTEAGSRKDDSNNSNVIEEVTCTIPTASDAPAHETFATMLMGVSPSVIVNGMPGVLCVRQRDMLRSSVMISLTMSGFIAAAALGMFFAARLALSLMCRRVANLCRRLCWCLNSTGCGGGLWRRGWAKTSGGHAVGAGAGAGRLGLGHIKQSKLDV